MCCVGVIFDGVKYNNCGVGPCCVSVFGSIYIRSVTSMLVLVVIVIVIVFVLFVLGVG